MFGKDVRMKRTIEKRPGTVKSLHRVERIIKLIAFFNCMGVELTNMTAGGEGRLQHVPSKETRQKISEAGKGRPAKHLKTPIAIQFLNGECVVFPSVSEASLTLKVSRRLIRMWQTGKAKPKYYGVQSAIKLPRK